MLCVRYHILNNTQPCLKKFPKKYAHTGDPKNKSSVAGEGAGGYGYFLELHISYLCVIPASVYCTVSVC